MTERKCVRCRLGGDVGSDTLELELVNRSLVVPYGDLVFAPGVHVRVPMCKVHAALPVHVLIVHIGESPS